ncbi:hypothetical protein [Mucisphaera sp.]|uniref:hypothetical protein n=1 Tax=Mucisphaera sp. TaxID=2913024 RepID=UPI003D0C9E49
MNDLIISNAEGVSVYDLSYLPGDFDQSDTLDHADLAYITARFGTGDESADLDDSGTVDADDLNLWLNWVKWTQPGDTNLDRRIDLIDLSNLATHFGGPGDYAQGDFDGSGTVDLIDLSILATHFGFDNSSPLVPEPAALPLLTLAAAARLRPRATPTR